MELMQLEMLVAVAEEESFFRAAERVFRTQPAVSIGIRKLEATLGVALLDRSNRRSCRLTAVGERLYQYARKILELRHEALCAVKAPETPGDTLRIGVVEDEILNRFSLLLKRFKERYPALGLRIHADTLSTVLAELADGHLDVALVSSRPKCDAPDKNLLATRLSQVSRQGWLWMVRPHLGNSSWPHALERISRELFPTDASLVKSKGIRQPRLRVVR